jgi:hypothetical protein
MGMRRALASVPAVLIVSLLLVSLAGVAIDAGGGGPGQNMNPTRLPCRFYFGTAPTLPLPAGTPPCPTNRYYAQDYNAGYCLYRYPAAPLSGIDATKVNYVTNLDQCGSWCCKGRMCADYSCTGGYTPKSNRQCVYDTTLNEGVCTRSHCCDAPPPPPCSLGPCSATTCGTSGTRSATSTPVGTAHLLV